MSTQKREDKSKKMLYFKNVDLATTYHVSLRTVLNWIEAAKQGKLDLALHVAEDKHYVANTARNVAIIDKIVNERKKYRNTRGHKVVAPKARFYKLYNEHQVLDLISNIETYHEIPHKYTYFDGGADSWNQYSQRLATEDNPNSLNSTLKLLANNEAYIDDLVASCDRINVIDIGVGNALPVRGFLQHLLDKEVLGRYAGLDISTEMLNLAESNIKEWFGKDINFEGHSIDISYNRFGSLFAKDYIGRDPKGLANVLILFGGTLGNLRAPDDAMRAIHDSMGKNDILLHAQKLDTEASRQYFDYSINDNPEPLSPQENFVVDLLGIDDSYYDVEMGYDERRRERYIRIRLKVALTIKFQFDQGIRAVDLNKDDAILLWRYLHQTPTELHAQFERNDFNILQMSLTSNKEYVLTVSKLKTESQ